MGILEDAMNRKNNVRTKTHTDDNVIRVLFRGDHPPPPLDKMTRSHERRCGTLSTRIDNREWKNRSSYKNKVLIIDESALFRHMTRAMLSDHGYMVLESESGDQGIMTIHYEKPDLIILDATMPGTNAFEILDEIQTSEVSVNIPVIILTSEDLFTSHQSDGLYAADDFLLKPFTPAHLMEKVNQYINPLHLEKTRPI